MYFLLVIIASITKPLTNRKANFPRGDLSLALIAREGDVIK